MGLFDNFFKQKTKIVGLLKNNIALTTPHSVKESVKGMVEQDIQTILQSVRGTPHPYDMKQMNDFYSRVPIIHGAINKIVDFTVGPGFNIKTEDESVKEYLDVFMKEQDFDDLLRTIVRDCLVYGDAYVEIVTTNNVINQLVRRNPETMHVKRDEKGNVLGYAQVLNKIMTPISFELKEIAHFKIGQYKDTPYGLSAIFPLSQVLQRKLQLEKDLNTLTTRKANAPYNITVGNEENFPSVDDLTTVKQSTEDLQNDQEWVHGPLVTIDAIGFKDKMMDLSPYLEYYENQLIYGLEVPQVLLGKGNIPEGLATAQKDAFERKITSVQLAIEQVLETTIFPRVLEANGVSVEGLQIEFEWNEPDADTKMEEIKVLTTIVQAGSFGAFSPEFMSQVEVRLATLFGFETSDNPKPAVPPQPKPAIPFQQTYNYEIEESFNPELLEMPLPSYVGNYEKYKEQIKKFIDSKRFLERRWPKYQYVVGDEWKLLSKQEAEDQKLMYSLATILSKPQIKELRNILNKAFDEGLSIRKIQKEIMGMTGFEGKRLWVDPITNDSGETLRNGYWLNITKEQRAMVMARTEPARASREGMIMYMKKLGIERMKWITLIDENTCAYCEDQDGMIYDIAETIGLQPAHANCRCDWVTTTDEAE